VPAAIRRVVVAHGSRYFGSRYFGLRHFDVHHLAERLSQHGLFLSLFLCDGRRLDVTGITGMTFRHQELA
jgi:hypothetical protein